MVHEELVIEQKRFPKPMEIDEPHRVPNFDIKIPIKSEEKAVKQANRINQLPKARTANTGNMDVR